MKPRLLLIAFVMSILMILTAVLAQDRQDLTVDQRPALPFPSSVDVESLCGETNELKQVEEYDGTLGVSVNYVTANSPSTFQFRWISDADIVRLGYSPGDIALKEWCTGTLLSNNLAVTAGHCFDVQNDKYGWTTPSRKMPDGRQEFADPKTMVQFQKAYFNYQVNRATGAPRVPDAYPIMSLIEHGNGGLDYAIVKLGQNDSGHYPAERYSPASVSLQFPQVHDILAIIQHPRGETKKIGVGHVFGILGAKLLYNDIDTLDGSSGSGVRNPSGELVAVHTDGGCISNANIGVLLSEIAKVSDKF